MNSSPQDTSTDTHMLQRFVSTEEESFISFVSVCHLGREEGWEQVWEIR